MRISNAIRDSLGLSQHQLVDFIGKDLSLLSRVEADSMELVNGADYNIHTLNKFQNIEFSAMVNPEMDEVLIKQLVFHARLCRNKSAGLQKKFNKMRESYAQGMRLIHCLNRLRAAQDIVLTTRQKRWIEERHSQALRKMKYCDPGIQKKLSLSIQALEAEAALYETAVKGG